MKKSIGRTLAQIDVVANTSVCIHEDFFNSHRDYHQLSHFEIVSVSEFFNSHRDYHQLSQTEIGGDKRISQHVPPSVGKSTEHIVQLRIAQSASRRDA
jgi:hypothetical protein